MSEDQKASAMDWAKLVIGTLLFVVLLYVHAYVKDLPIYILALPALLWGVDVGQIIAKAKK